MDRKRTREGRPTIGLGYDDTRKKKNVSKKKKQLTLITGLKCLQSNSDGSVYTMLSTFSFRMNDKRLLTKASKIAFFSSSSSSCNALCFKYLFSHLLNNVVFFCTVLILLTRFTLYCSMYITKSNTFCFCMPQLY